MNRYIPIFFLIFLFSIPASRMKAQKFNVSEFRMLPNDISAFINPVRDLNGDDCALLKIEAGEDFAFSTPLGIVKRIDDTGEIWLYIPRGSKSITIKHPQFGVIRDYIFPVKIDSHMAYEMRINIPAEMVKSPEIRTIINTVRDTLVVTKTDTVMLLNSVKKTPFSLSTIATVGFGGRTNTLCGGIMLTAMRRHGAWIHLQTDFNRIGKTINSCNRYGAVDGYTPYYTGKKRHGSLLISAGAIHRLSSVVNIFEGVGYGCTSVAWQLSDKEGGGFVKNSYYSGKGVFFEAGSMINIRKLVLTASVGTIAGKQWFGSIGIGYKFSK